MDRRNILMLGLGSLSAATMGWRPARAQGAYPQRPIRLIVPRSAGGVLDVIGRHWAEWATRQFGQGVAVENQGGGGGITGTAAAAHAAADGYTLLLGSTSDLVLNPVLSSASLYDPVKDFTPVAIIAISVAAIIVHPSVPAQNLKELAAYAKANPGKLSYGSAGAGTMANLCGELFKTLAGTPDIVHIPYKGSAPGLTDLASGHIPMMTPNVGGALLDFHRTGKVRILAVAAETRLRAAPDIPTATEAGLPGMVAGNFNGLFAPAGLAAPIIDQLASATRMLMADATFDQLLVASGFEPTSDSGPEQARRLVTDEVARWAPIMRATNFKME